jgi:hypothetical protein
MPTYTPAQPGVWNTASFYSDTYTYDPLYADATVAQSANIAGGLGALKRGTVLFGPLSGTPITVTTLLTTVATGAIQRCILAQDIDTTGGQVTGVVYTQGKFLDTAMTFTSLGAASDCAQLWDFGIYVLTVEQRSGILVPMMKLPTTGGPLPQSLSAKDSIQATKDEVAAIQAAMAAYQPPGTVPTPPPAGIKTPAWALAQFGTPTPTQTQQVEAQVAEKADTLAQEQQQQMDQLNQQYTQQMSALLQKQAQERQQLAQQADAAKTQAQQADAASQTQTTKPPQQ